MNTIGVELTPGKDMDRRVHRQLKIDLRSGRKILNYSTVRSDAWVVVDWAVTIDFLVTITPFDPITKQFEVSMSRDARYRDGWSRHESLSMAICEAYISAIHQPEEDSE